MRSGGSALFVFLFFLALSISTLLDQHIESHVR